MSGYNFVENMQKHAIYKTVTQKFKLLCMTYGIPREVCYDKGLQFSEEFENFLKDMKVLPTLNSTRNPS